MDRKYAEYLFKKTRDDYNRIAEDFSRTRESPWEEIEFLFREYLKEGDKVLDLGCGNGRHFPLFKEKEANYFGLDFSEKLIEIAKNKYPGATFQAGDALNLTFPENFFDKVYSIATLHHIPSEELRAHFLKETKRVLKPGGILVLTVWKFHQLKEISSLFKYTILKLFGKTKLDWKDILEPWGKKIERYYHWFSKKELKGLVQKADFKIEKIGTTKNQRGNRQNIYLIAQKTAPIPVGVGLNPAKRDIESP
jgi:tRNA (uracil-5-)-methyltransferase TRM9